MAFSHLLNQPCINREDALPMMVACHWSACPATFKTFDRTTAGLSRHQETRLHPLSHQMPGAARALIRRLAPRRLVQRRHLATLSTTRPVEPEQEDCCGGGCRHCVWDTYAEELRDWQERQAGRLSPSPQTQLPVRTVSTGIALHESTSAEPGRTRTPSDIYVCECGRTWLR